MSFKMRRKRRGTGTGEKIYFTQAVQDAIIEYNKSEDPLERNKIYEERIEYAFDKVAENIINRFKFPYILESTPFEPLKQQVVSYMVVHLGKFSEGKGKAFSYFSVVAKNYLILQNDKAYQESKRNLSLSDASSDGSPVSMEEITELETPVIDDADSKEFTELMIIYWEDNVHKIFKKKRDIDIANAVIELFRRAHTIESFNKKALYILIREQTDCKTSYITKVITKMKAQVMSHLLEYRRRGTLNSDDSDEE